MNLERRFWISFVNVSLISLFLGQIYAAPDLNGGDPQKGLEIATLTDKAYGGFKGESSDMTLTIINAYGDETLRKMSNKSMETKDDGDKAIVNISWPADVKGTKLLTWTHKVGNDDRWLYLPSFKRVKRISARNQSGSFMGSEFSFEDFSSQEIEKNDHYFIQDDTLDNRTVWLMRQVPTEKNSGYSKRIVWIDKEYKSPLRIDYYDRKGELLKTAMFEEYQLYGKKWWRMNKISVKNIQTGKSSVIEWRNRKMGQQFKNRDFTKARLTESL